MTQVFTRLFSPDEDNVARALLTALEKSMKNSMLSNTDKTQIMNILINYRSGACCKPRNNGILWN